MLACAPHPSAPLWRRLCAIVYDTFLLFALAMMYTAVHLFIKGMLLGTETLKSAKAGHAGDPLLFVGVLLCWFLFYYWFWTRNGQTLGMQAWRLRVEQQDGDNITARQSTLRLLVAPLSLLCFGIGYLWCLGRENKSWQDIASQTRIVVLPGLPKKSAQP
jgi:uncharacterized RDD family membrane protein YckC